MLNRIWRNDSAVGNPLVTVFVICTSASANIEQLAGKPGMQQLVGIFILELDEAALTAPVAQGFPLILRHLAERLGTPKWFVVFAQSVFPKFMVMDLPEYRV